jgi:hypothetical protein
VYQTFFHTIPFINVFYKMPLLSFKSFTSILLIMASRSENEMTEPAEKKNRLESFLDDCVASIQPPQIIRPSSPSEVNLNFAGLSITEKLKTSGRGVFAYSGGWSSSSSTLSWGHGRPTSFNHEERSPGAGRGSGRQLLRSPPPSEKDEVEPDLRSSTSSDDGYQARAPTPERFKRYSLKRTWPQPADLLYKEAKLAALEVEEFNLTRIYINDLNQLREQYERELAQLRLWSKDQLNKEDKKNCFK